MKEPDHLSGVSNQTGNDAEGIMEFAPQTDNPYTLSNMQSAKDSLAAHNSSECDLTRFVIRVTHKYIKFKPIDSTQYAELIYDSTLILFDYPMDRTITKGGTYYRDPSVPEGQPNYQWCCVAADKVLPSGVPYDVLAELYLPEEDPNLVQFYETEFDDCITLLIDEALKRTGNYDTSSNYGGMTSGGELYKSLPSKWTPAGNIRRTDNRLNANVNLEGAKVRAHRMFETRESLTDANGNFNVGHQFRYPVNYSIKWERNDFDIRSGTFGQAYFNGPKQRGNWNLIISSGKSRHYAHIHVACVDYFSRANSQFVLTPPPKNTWFNPRLHIAAHNSNNADKNAMTHPWSRVFGVFPTMGFWNPNRRSDFLYGTAIHELAHYAHWGFDKWTFNFGSDIVIESWADGVEFIFASWRYGNYGDATDDAGTLGGTDSYQERVIAGAFFNANVGFFSKYTPLVVDLMDDENQRNTRGHGGSIDWPIDRVSGYTPAQIEATLKKLNLLNIGFAPPSTFTINSMWTQWETHLRDDYTNGTEQFLAELFANW